MIVRLPCQSIHRYSYCVSLTQLRGQARNFATGSNVCAQLKKVSEAPSNSQVSTSFKEKAKDNAKTGGYGLVVIGGLGLIAVVVGTILKVSCRRVGMNIILTSIVQELFSSGSANNIYDRAVKRCQDHEKVQDLLGEPIKAFGEESRRGRRNRVSQMPYQDPKSGKKGMRVQFYLQGSRNRAVVEVDAREDEGGSMVTRYILVRVEDWLRNSVVVEDNRRQ